MSAVAGRMWGRLAASRAAQLGHSKDEPTWKAVQGYSASSVQSFVLMDGVGCQEKVLPPESDWALNRLPRAEVTAPGRAQAVFGQCHLFGLKAQLI